MNTNTNRESAEEEALIIIESPPNSPGNLPFPTEEKSLIPESPSSTITPTNNGSNSNIPRIGNGIDEQNILLNAINPKIKIQLIEECENNKIEEIGDKYKIGANVLEEWINVYKRIGESEYLRREEIRIRFLPYNTKVSILKEVKKIGIERATAKYGVSKESLREWERVVDVEGEHILGRKCNSGTPGTPGTCGRSGTYTLQQKIDIGREAATQGVNAVLGKYDISKKTLNYWVNTFNKLGGAHNHMNTNITQGPTFRELQANFTQEDKVNVIKYYSRHGLKAACNKFGCSDYYIYLWKNKIDGMGVDNFLQYKTNKYSKNTMDMAKPTALSPTTFQALNKNTENITNNDYISNNLGYIDSIYTTEGVTADLNNNYYPGSKRTSSDIYTTPDMNNNEYNEYNEHNEYNEYNTGVQQLMLLQHNNSNIDENNLVSFEEINGNNDIEMNHKEMFLGDMEKLLPPHLFIQFKHMHANLVEIYLFKALHTYPNTASQS